METSTSSSNTRTWTVLCHASALIGFFVPWAGHIGGPLVVWLAKRGDSPEIDAHGKESLNFQISMLIYSLIAGVLCLVLIGFVLLGILHILNLVLVIIASIQASEGKLYRYPISIRLIK
jgi:uncharacterized Tic20 family protein